MQEQQEETQRAPMSLSEIIPKPAEFSLRSTGETYTVRPFSIDDSEWIKSKYTVEELEHILQEWRMSDIVKITYHQLIFEDKKKFLAEEIEEVNDDGELIKRKLTGVEKFMRAIQGPDEEYQIYNALMEARGMSLPVVEKLGQQLEELNQNSKKKQ